MEGLTDGTFWVPLGGPLHELCIFSGPGLHETLALLTSQLRPDSNHKEEMGFLRDVFSEKSLSYLMKVHPRFLFPWHGVQRETSELPGAGGCHPGHSLSQRFFLCHCSVGAHLQLSAPMGWVGQAVQCSG